MRPSRGRHCCVLPVVTAATTHKNSPWHRFLAMQNQTLPRAGCGGGMCRRFARWNRRAKETASAGFERAIEAIVTHPLCEWWTKSQKTLACHGDGCRWLGSTHTRKAARIKLGKCPHHRTHTNINFIHTHTHTHTHTCMHVNMIHRSLTLTTANRYCTTTTISPRYNCHGMRCDWACMRWVHQRHRRHRSSSFVRPAKLTKHTRETAD